jgi:hypothetical protein
MNRDGILRCPCTLADFKPDLSADHASETGHRASFEAQGECALNLVSAFVARKVKTMDTRLRLPKMSKPDSVSSWI